MLVIGLPCDCVWCQDIRKIHKDVYGNPEVRNRIDVGNRKFEARIIRIGRASGVPNKRMMEAKINLGKLFNAIFGGSNE